MVYKNIYHKLCKDQFVNMICDGQAISLIWDIDSEIENDWRNAKLKRLEARLKRE